MVPMLSISWLLPWEFSPTVLLVCCCAMWAFMRGARNERRAGRKVNAWRQFGFYLGVAFIYVPLQTHFDYLAQHMFWIHRLQHMFLHHLGPMLMALSAPWAVMAAGLPNTWHARVHRVWCDSPLRRVYRVIQHPLIAATLFVGLIYFWLRPAVHFNAMLNAREYQIMNWSMAIDGLLFWWLMFDPRSREQGAQMHFGPRIPLVLLVILPQAFLGAYLGLHKSTIYDVYAVCGRLWPIDPVTDQQLGGLITWIPSSMMSAVAALILIGRWMHNDSPRTRRRSAPAAVIETHSTPQTQA